MHQNNIISSAFHTTLIYLTKRTSPISHCCKYASLIFDIVFNSSCFVVSLLYIFFSSFYMTGKILLLHRFFFLLFLPSTNSIVYRIHQIASFIIILNKKSFEIIHISTFAILFWTYHRGLSSLGIRDSNKSYKCFL